MYKIGDKVVYKKSGVCVVDSIQDKDFGNGNVTYYYLLPYYNKNATKIMIPVDRGDLLRDIISKEEALKIIDYIPKAEDCWIQDSKTRREKFSNVMQSGNIKELCSLINTLNNKRKEFSKNKKMLSMMDKEAYQHAEKLVFEEIATSLNISLEDTRDFVNNRINSKEK